MEIKGLSPIVCLHVLPINKSRISNRYMFTCKQDPGFVYRLFTCIAVGDQGFVYCLFTCITVGDPGFVYHFFTCIAVGIHVLFIICLHVLPLEI